LGPIGQSSKRVIWCVSFTCFPDVVQCGTAGGWGYSNSKGRYVASELQQEGSYVLISRRFPIQTALLHLSSTEFTSGPYTGFRAGFHRVMNIKVSLLLSLLSVDVAVASRATVR